MTLLMLVGLFMMLIVLIQRGRGGGLAGAFGGAGGSSAFGTKAGDVFTKITVVCALIWFCLAGFSGMALRARASRYTDGEDVVAKEDGDDADSGSAIPTESATGGDASAADAPDMGDFTPLEDGPDLPATPTPGAVENGDVPATPPADVTPEAEAGADAPEKADPAEGDADGEKVEADPDAGAEAADGGAEAADGGDEKADDGN